VLELHVDDAGAHCRLKRGMVLLGLISVNDCPFAHRLVKIVVLAEIATDRPGVTGLCMGPRQDLAARLAVNRQHFGVIGLH
jgi:hypothetical protein